MKLAISTLVCPEWTLDQIINACKAAGIEGIDFRGLGRELDITKLPEFTTDLDTTLRRIREAGLKLPCFNTSLRLIVRDPVEWNGFLEEAQRYAQLATRTGTETIRVFGGAVPEGMSRDEARIIAERHLRQLSKICLAHNCLPVLETHDQWKTSTQVLELLRDFTPDEVGVLWDLEHPYRMGEPFEETAQRLAPFLRHTHIKDSRRDDGKFKATLLGEGNLPLPQAIEALKSIGYDGWISLETEKRWHPTAPDPEQSIPQFAEYVRPLIGR